MRRAVSWLWLIAVMLVNTQAAFAGTLYPKVLVSVAPLVPYTDAILQGIGASQCLIRAGQDPHSFTLAPTQAKMLADADMLIVPDLGMSPLLGRLVKNYPKLKIVSLSTFKGANALPYADENPWVAKVKAVAGAHADDEKFEPHDHYQHVTGKRNAEEEKSAAPSAPAIDPHFWLDPERMAAIAGPLAETIADFAPDQRRVLEQNATALAQHLRRDVTPSLRAMLHASAGDDIHTTKPEIPFITYHAAYQYFLARFGLTPQGQIISRPEEYLGAKSLDELLRAAKGITIRCIIGEQDTPLVRKIAVLSQARVVLISPEQLVNAHDVPPLDWVQNDYDRLLYMTAKRFGECL